jgi:hypothetical protein
MKKYSLLHDLRLLEKVLPEFWYFAKILEDTPNFPHLEFEEQLLEIVQRVHNKIEQKKVAHDLDSEKQDLLALMK